MGSNGKPGERVPTTGIYRVDHDAHRLMHHAVLTQGMLFPSCRICCDQVTFALVRPVRGSTTPFRSSEILVAYREPELQPRS